MQSNLTSRRSFFKSSAAAVAGTALVPYTFTADAEENSKPRSANDRFRIGAIGMRYQGTVITDKAREYGDVVAICDIDRHVREQARSSFGSTPAIYEDYRALLDRKDVDVVTIGTPDHWHTKMLIDACRAGKDVYIEKPLTLTIDEGKQLGKVVRETNRVVQVGSWHRSDDRFRLAVEMVRQGRLGQLKRIEVVLGKNKSGGPFPTRTVPGHLNWDLWQGQTPAVPYIEERCHYTFRWWYEYSGGQLTDWGAHHMDIAQWAAGMEGSGPVRIEGRAKFPDVPDGYNVAIDFEAKYVFPGGVEMVVLDHGRNGILFEGTEGRIFVNRGTLEGSPVEALADAPLPREQYKLYAHDNLARPPREGKLDAIVNHMGNFFDCVKSRQQPISDVYSQHRSVSTCHLGNISMRLGRPLQWDPEKERFVGDDEANGHLAREQRAPYTV
ncbi:MAG: Gfo/Idh/MocA family oxidoreductase [Rhodopirellula sp.]|nr:Gfo/Idh/MocA family oxidoreductase [Rhodopirellula sp.]